MLNLKDSFGRTEELYTVLMEKLNYSKKFQKMIFEGIFIHQKTYLKYYNQIHHFFKAFQIKKYTIKTKAQNVYHSVLLSFLQKIMIVIRQILPRFFYQQT